VLWLTAAATSARAGQLEICPDHPYYFRDENRHVVLVGVSDRALFTVWKNNKGFSWRKYLDDITAHRLNYVRQDVFSWGQLLTPARYPAQFSNPGWPFARVGPGVAVDGRPKFDLTKFEQSYFEERIKPFLRETAKRGVYVELTLFEGFHSRSFAESLYCDRNNVNDLGLTHREVTSDAALHRSRLMAIQEAYVDKILEETAGFGNVIYEIANETGGKQWVAHFVDYIHRHPTHESRLVSAGEQSTSFDPMTGANDVVVKHRGRGGLYATDADIYNHHNALVRFRIGKPVCHNEYFLFANRSTEDANFPRKMMWADFTAGGHSNFFDFTFWRGTGRTVAEGQPSQSPPREILRGGQHLVDFLFKNDVGFWTMAPHDELAFVKGDGRSYVFTFANPGEEYVCYVLGEGPVTIALCMTTDTFTSRWYDPKRGRFLTPEERICGKDETLFSSPSFKEDIVLYIHRPRPGTK
jgi:hypothetical protein